MHASLHYKTTPPTPIVTLLWFGTLVSPMGDPHDDPGAKSFSTPPGCGFHPSQQQLLSYYLTKKNNVDGEGSDGCDLIGELDLYHYDPFELPEGACFSYGYGAGKRHWYCYVARNAKESEAGRRRTKTGYWRRKWGKVRDVMDPRGGGKVLLGTRSSFVFYQKNSHKTAARITDWVIHEYALPDHLKASFVLCRVFFKSCIGNSILDNGLSSCAEEAVSAVRHIGIQHNGCLTPDILEAKMHDDNSVTGASILHQLGMQPREPVSSSVLPGSSAKIFEGLTDQQALSILEEDYIELDDLVQ